MMYVTLINVCGVVFLTAEIFATVLDDEIDLKKDHDLIEDLLQKKDSMNFRFSKFLDIRFDVDDNKPFNVEELIRSKIDNDSEGTSNNKTITNNSSQQESVRAEHDYSQRLLTRIDDLTNTILNLSTALNEMKHEMRELKKEKNETEYKSMEFRENVSVVLAGLNHQMREMRGNVSSILGRFNREGAVLTEMVNEMKELGKSMFILSENQTSIQNAIKECRYSEQNRSEHNTSHNLPQDCKEVLNRGSRFSGTYEIQPNSSTKPFSVLCDMNIYEGGWTHIQKRFDGSQNFFLGWKDYKAGFGKIDGEFWLGLDKIHFLTSANSELLIELVDENGNIAYAHYKFFSIGDESDGYRLSNPSFLDGSAGDSFSKHGGQKFSTKDNDQDSSSKNCADYYGGAWWYYNCLESDLNAKLVNYNGKTDRVYWNSAPTESLKFPAKTRMLVRRL